ncbi:hypothetical protein E2C01_090403 [Portunus trituberculatus]|uniref:Uncharacterized protein n=1 Tax=Portunus trituberculatus TaxID=210409 RepID=A0A5B7JGH3_PORTR|nr:hypothetical protein [Portunus trituberculatus]
MWMKIFAGWGEGERRSQPGTIAACDVRGAGPDADLWCLLLGCRHVDKLLILLRPLAQQVHHVLLLGGRHHDRLLVDEALRSVDEHNVVLQAGRRHWRARPHDGRKIWGAVDVQVAGDLGRDAAAVNVTHLASTTASTTAIAASKASSKATAKPTAKVTAKATATSTSTAVAAAASSSAAAAMGEAYARGRSATITLLGSSDCQQR